MSLPIITTAPTTNHNLPCFTHKLTLNNSLKLSHSLTATTQTIYPSILLTHTHGYSTQYTHCTLHFAKEDNRTTHTIHQHSSQFLQGRSDTITHTNLTKLITIHFTSCLEAESSSKEIKELSISSSRKSNSQVSTYVEF